MKQFCLCSTNEIYIFVSPTSPCAIQPFSLLLWTFILANKQTSLVKINDTNISIWTNWLKVYNFYTSFFKPPCLYMQTAVKSGQEDFRKVETAWVSQVFARGAVQLAAHDRERLPLDQLLSQRHPRCGCAASHLILSLLRTRQRKCSVLVWYLELQQVYEYNGLN